MNLIKIKFSSADIQFVEINNGWEDFNMLHRRPIVRGKSGTIYVGPRGYHHQDLLDEINGGHDTWDWASWPDAAAWTDTGDAVGDLMFFSENPEFLATKDDILQAVFEREAQERTGKIAAADERGKLPAELLAKPWHSPEWLAYETDYHGMYGDDLDPQWLNYPIGYNPENGLWEVGYAGQSHVSEESRQDVMSTICPGVKEWDSKAAPMQGSINISDDEYSVYWPEHIPSDEIKQAMITKAFKRADKWRSYCYEKDQEYKANGETRYKQTKTAGYDYQLHWVDSTQNTHGHGLPFFVMDEKLYIGTLSTYHTYLFEEAGIDMWGGEPENEDFTMGRVDRFGNAIATYGPPEDVDYAYDVLQNNWPEIETHFQKVPRQVINPIGLGPGEDGNDEDDMYENINELGWQTINVKENYDMHQEQLAADPSMRMTKKAEADMSGAMLALRVPDSVAQAIEIEGGEPASLMHITLAYFKDAAADRDDWDQVQEITAKYPQFNGLQGAVTGYGTFENDEVVLWAQPEVEGLEELRNALVADCNAAGFPVDDKFPDFKPHITLKYSWEGDMPELEQPLPMTFDGLYFYQGEKMKKVANMQEEAKRIMQEVDFYMAQEGLQKTAAGGYWKWYYLPDTDNFNVWPVGGPDGDPTHLMMLMGDAYDGSEDPDAFSDRIIAGDQDEILIAYGTSGIEQQTALDRLEEAGYVMSGDLWGRESRIIDNNELRLHSWKWAYHPGRPEFMAWLVDPTGEPYHIDKMMDAGWLAEVGPEAFGILTGRGDDQDLWCRNTDYISTSPTSEELVTAYELATQWQMENKPPKPQAYDPTVSVDPVRGILEELKQRIMERNSHAKVEQVLDGEYANFTYSTLFVYDQGADKMYVGPRETESSTNYHINILENLVDRELDDPDQSYDFDNMYVMGESSARKEDGEHIVSTYWHSMNPGPAMASYLEGILAEWFSEIEPAPEVAPSESNLVEFNKDETSKQSYRGALFVYDPSKDILYIDYNADFHVRILEQILEREEDAGRMDADDRFDFNGVYLFGAMKDDGRAVFYGDEAEFAHETPEMKRAMELLPKEEEEEFTGRLFAHAATVIAPNVTEVTPAEPNGKCTFLYDVQAGHLYIGGYNNYHVELMEQALEDEEVKARDEMAADYQWANQSLKLREGEDYIMGYVTGQNAFTYTNEPPGSDGVVWRPEPQIENRLKAAYDDYLAKRVPYRTSSVEFTPYFYPSYSYYSMNRVPFIYLPNKAELHHSEPSGMHSDIYFDNEAGKMREELYEAYGSSVAGYIYGQMDEPPQFTLFQGSVDEELQQSITDYLWGLYGDQINAYIDAEMRPLAKTAEYDFAEFDMTDWGYRSWLYWQGELYIQDYDMSNHFELFYAYDLDPMTVMEDTYVAGQIWPINFSTEADIQIASDYLEAEAWYWEEGDLDTDDEAVATEKSREMVNRNRREGELFNRAIKEVTRWWYERHPEVPIKYNGHPLANPFHVAKTAMVVHPIVVEDMKFGWDSVAFAYDTVKDVLYWTDGHHPDIYEQMIDDGYQDSEEWNTFDNVKWGWFHNGDEPGVSNIFTGEYKSLTWSSGNMANDKDTTISHEKALEIDAVLREVYPKSLYTSKTARVINNVKRTDEISYYDGTRIPFVLDRVNGTLYHGLPGSVHQNIYETFMVEFSEMIGRKYDQAEGAIVWGYYNKRGAMESYADEEFVLTPEEKAEIKPILDPYFHGGQLALSKKSYDLAATGSYEPFTVHVIEHPNYRWATAIDPVARNIYVAEWHGQIFEFFKSQGIDNNFLDITQKAAESFDWLSWGVAPDTNHGGFERWDGLKLQGSDEEMANEALKLEHLNPKWAANDWSGSTGCSKTAAANLNWIDTSEDPRIHGVGLPIMDVTFDDDLYIATTSTWHTEMMQVMSDQGMVDGWNDADSAGRVYLDENDQLCVTVYAGNARGWAKKLEPYADILREKVAPYKNLGQHNLDDLGGVVLKVGKTAAQIKHLSDGEYEDESWIKFIWDNDNQIFYWWIVGMEDGFPSHSEQFDTIGWDWSAADENPDRWAWGLEVADPDEWDYYDEKDMITVNGLHFLVYSNRGSEDTRQACIQAIQQWQGKTISKITNVELHPLDNPGQPGYGFVYFPESDTLHLTGGAFHADLLKDIYNDNENVDRWSFDDGYLGDMGAGYGPNHINIAGSIDPDVKARIYELLEPYMDTPPEELGLPSSGYTYPDGREASLKTAADELKIVEFDQGQMDWGGYTLAYDPAANVAYYNKKGHHPDLVFALEGLPVETDQNTNEARDLYGKWGESLWWGWLYNRRWSIGSGNVKFDRELINNKEFVASKMEEIFQAVRGYPSEGGNL